MLVLAAVGLPMALAFDARGTGPDTGWRGRGLVGIRLSRETVSLSWRLLPSDRWDVGFHVYRSTGGGAPVRVTKSAVRGPTQWLDDALEPGMPHTWTVRAVVDGAEQPPSQPFVLAVDAPVRPYLRIPLQTPEGYAPNDAAPGDLDGDGEPELVLHQAGRGRDNSQAGPTDPPILEAYRLDGTRLWQIRLGPNIREGAHYTQFVVADLDGDGRAEVACRTADATIDGTGRSLGDPAARHARTTGRTEGKILDGPEFLTVFDGRSGAALASVPYVPERGDPTAWGDDYGNRVDRFLAGAAWLDRELPSLIFCRGYYTRAVVVAWDWRGGKLSRRWVFDSDAGPETNRAWRGQGNHGLSVADVDGDGRDEILYGSCAIDDSGAGLYSTGLGHGDAFHVGDLDPDRPGLEVFAIHEKPRHAHGISFRDARTGKVLWSRPSPDVGRGVAADIDPRHPGAECWASGPGLETLFSARGEPIGPKPRSCNFVLWWDGDPLRELLDGTRILKWDPETSREMLMLDAAEYGCAANHGTKATPCLSGDLFGDWREEVVWRSRDNRELRIFMSTLPTSQRRVTLTADRQYRAALAWQNTGYNQPPHPSSFLPP